MTSLPLEYRGEKSLLAVLPERRSQRLCRCEWSRFPHHEKGRSRAHSSVTQMRETLNLPAYEKAPSASLVTGGAKLLQLSPKETLRRQIVAGGAKLLQLSPKETLRRQIVAGERHFMQFASQRAFRRPREPTPNRHSPGASSLGASDEWCARSGPLGAW